MRILSWSSSVALAGICAAIAIATPASGADLYTEPAPSYGYQSPRPPPAYGPPPYVQEGYFPAPYYRPYRPVYRPYAWGPPYGYPRRYVEVAPRPPAPIVGMPARPWGAYPHYDEDIAEAAPPAYGYPPPPPRW